MYTNMYEQTKELAVLRALGLTIKRVTRIFILEAFTLVASASLLGIFIGAALAWALQLQRGIFTQFPLIAPFPWNIVLAALSASVICSFLATLIPARSLLARPIAAVMRVLS